tara:strand:+ start:408 stop:680 length:273 start_codon:yes stop_codon:yes gene_type:complete
MSNNPIVDTPQVGETVIVNGKLIEKLQSLFETLGFVINSGKMNEYLLADLPDATKCKGCSLIVTNETGGYVSAISDGTNWRRSTDLAVVS